MKGKNTELVQELQRRLTEAQTQVEDAANKAQEIINQRDEQIRRITSIARSWHKGELGAMDAIASVLAETDGFPPPEANDLERQRAYRCAQHVSLLTERTGRLAAVSELLAEQGVEMTSTEVQQLKDYIRLQKGWPR